MRPSSCLLVPAFLSLSIAFGTLAVQAADDKPLAATGKAVPELAGLDRLMTETMARHHFPGGALAMAKDGRLVFAHGYGLADAVTGKPVEPDAMFRIASLSKPITSAAVLKLVEAGKLKLDDKAIDLIGDIGPPPGKQLDPRSRQNHDRAICSTTPAASISARAWTRCSVPG